ncbi:MAG: GH25 family lysozyme [Eubacteriales bacterium]|nr:GH25 family lysozyme [Eubacteriales bacterium]
MAKIYPDISHYAPVTNWAAVQQSCPFLISKATEGTSFVDSTLNSFIAGCENKKIPYWLYAYLRKGNELAQAKFLVNTCKGKIGSYFRGYILDVEAGNTAANVKTAINWLAGQSAKTMLYTMYAEYTNYKSVLSGRPSTCAWWEARYGRNDGSYSSQYPPHSGVDLHQYTDQGKVNGIRGDVDLNRLTGAKPESWFTEAQPTVYTTKEVTARIAAGSEKTAVGTLRKGVALTRITETEHWMQTAVWVAKRHCDIKNGTATLKNAAPVRASNGTSSTKLGTLEEGAALKVLERTPHWIQVPVWIAKKYTK